MLPRNLSGENSQPLFHSQELADGIPTVAGLAMLCSRSLDKVRPENSQGESAMPELWREALVILIAARERGMIELRGQSDSFDSSQRLIAVAVERDQDTRIIFRRKSDPAWTMSYVEGFRQLCQQGLVVHQFGREFVLSGPGFRFGRSLNAAEFADELQLAISEEM